MKRAITATLVLAVASTGLIAAPAAAQTEQQPQAQQPVLSVQSVLVPKSRRLFLSKGVLVTASCTPACLLVVNLQVSPEFAAKVGLKGSSVGLASANAPDSVPITIQARIRRAVARVLARVRAGGHLRIGITALP
jgi:hypothetical protein